MWSKHELKTITSLLALVLLTSSLIFAAPAQSAVAGPLKVTERLSSTEPSTSTTIHITACWVNAQRGDVIGLDEQSASTLLWKAVTHKTIATAKGCTVWARSSGVIGNYPYRAEVRQGRSILKVSSVTLERTFGTISAASFFVAEFGCQGSGTVSTGAQSYGYFCSLNAGPQSQSDYVTFPHTTTCRSLTLSMIATGNAKGNPADHAAIVVEVQQDNVVQPAIFTDNELENFTYHLDSHAAALNVWDNQANSDGDAVYFLTSGSTANCSSRTGV
jgi:hypothetical protein